MGVVVTGRVGRRCCRYWTGCPGSWRAAEGGVRESKRGLCMLLILFDEGGEEEMREREEEKERNR